MSDIPVLPGIVSIFVETPRLRQHVLSCGNPDGEPIVLLHGNFSAATYWEELMLALTSSSAAAGTGQGFYCIAPDLRGYGWTEDKLINATRGYRDWADDLHELLDALRVARAHLVGWSMAGGIVYRFIADHPERVITATLQAPVSPYGFGGTKGIEGAPCFDDFAGSGGGVVSPLFIQRIQMGDRSADDANSPRNIINAFYYKPPFRAAREEDFLTASLMDYCLPRADNFPEIEVILCEVPCKTNPLGVKGVGEAGAIAATPAVVNAVLDALGVAHLDMPLTPEKVWRALRGSAQPQSARETLISPSVVRAGVRTGIQKDSH